MLGVGTKLVEPSACCGGSKWSINDVTAPRAQARAPVQNVFQESDHRTNVTVVVTYLWLLERCPHLVHSVSSGFGNKCWSIIGCLRYILRLRSYTKLLCAAPLQ